MSDPTSSQVVSFQSKPAHQGLRGSLRNLTWKSSAPTSAGSRQPRLFRKRVFSETSESSTNKDDWSEDFHLITRDDIGLSLTSSAQVFDDRKGITPVLLPEESSSKSTTVDILKPSESLSTTLPPLIIPDNVANRISNYTSESPTSTFTDFEHLASKFPLPPSHIPINSDSQIDPGE